MGLFGTTTFNSMDDLFVQQLEDLYDAENRIIDALGQMRDAAKNPQLKQGFDKHQEQSRGHARRLEQAFQMLGKSPERETCEAAKGLIKEGSEMISAHGDDDVRDAGLIAAAQRVEHYEIAGYGTARNLAQRIGRSDIATLLEQTLREEKETDALLTQLAESSVNPAAAATH